MRISNSPFFTTCPASIFISTTRPATWAATVARWTVSTTASAGSRRSPDAGRRRHAADRPPTRTTAARRKRQEGHGPEIVYSCLLAYTNIERCKARHLCSPFDHPPAAGLRPGKAQRAVFGATQGNDDESGAGANLLSTTISPPSRSRTRLWRRSTSCPLPPLPFGGEERVEDARTQFGGDAATVVGDLQTNGAGHRRSCDQVIHPDGLERMQQCSRPDW